MLKRHWIPAWPLVLAQLASGFSWIVILLAAGTGNFENPFYGFAWIHTVALAWITLAALAILIFALPTFTGVDRWRGDPSARICIALFAAGAFALIYGFLANASVLAPAAYVTLGALSVYLLTASATIAAAMRTDDRVRRAIARAFSITFAFLLATAIIGVMMAAVLSGQSSRDLGGMPVSHAHLGTVGWLSLLIFGVSMRTLRPITGSGGSRCRFIHIIAGSLGALAVILLASHLAWPGALAGALAALAYAFDVFDMLRRSQNPHRPPQAFVAASIIWLLCAVVLGFGVLLGRAWERAYIFVLLIGWAGQMVNAHLHHIGIRVLATVFRGEDDETEPQELLEGRLSWYAFASFQLAIIGVLVALLNDNANLAPRAAVFGLTAWVAMTANVAVAAVRARFTASQMIRL